MSGRRVVLGTRGSLLAVEQARPVAAHLEAKGWEVDWRRFTTHGDRWLEGPLDSHRGAGFFTRELEEALQHGALDLVVHSLKDVALERPEGLVTACIPRREDPLDWLLMRADAPTHPRIGTGAVRRQQLLCRTLPEATFTWIRGNVPTRLQHLRAGELRGEPLHGTLLAAAGLRRLGLDLSDLCVPRLAPEELLPAPGQGALLAECRAGHAALLEALSDLHHEATGRCVALERAVLAGLGGGCQQPLGAFAEALPEGRFRLRAAFARPSGIVDAEGLGSEAQALATVTGAFRAAGLP